jgi:hypothetical protein
MISAAFSIFVVVAPSFSAFSMARYPSTAAACRSCHAWVGSPSEKVR